MRAHTFSQEIVASLLFELLLMFTHIYLGACPVGSLSRARTVGVINAHLSVELLKLFGIVLRKTLVVENCVVHHHIAHIIFFLEKLTTRRKILSFWFDTFKK